jgi:hypothetical protein
METVDPHIVINFLNSILKIDNLALNELIMNKRVSCNKELGEHPTVQTLCDDNGSNYTVGLLGLLNGMCGKNEDGWGYIVARVDESNNEIISFIHIKDKDNK